MKVQTALRELKTTFNFKETNRTAQMFIQLGIYRIVVRYTDSFTEVLHGVCLFFKPFENSISKSVAAFRFCLLDKIFYSFRLNHSNFCNTLLVVTESGIIKSYGVEEKLKSYSSMCVCAVQQIASLWNLLNLDVLFNLQLRIYPSELNTWDSAVYTVREPIHMQ